MAPSDVPRSALRAGLASLRVDPVELAGLVEAYRLRVLPGRDDPDAARRWAGVEAALRSAGATGGALPPSEWRREPAGRLHATRPAAQCIPGFVRPSFVPRGAYLDADYVVAHPTIAAVRSGDRELLSDLSRPGYYEALAEEVLAWSRGHAWSEGVEASDLRSTVKRVVCAFVNGGRTGTSTRYLARAFRGARRAGVSPGCREDVRGVRDVGRWFYASWWARYPTLSSWGTAVARSWRPGVMPVRTLTGRELPVPCEGRDGWRTLLSSHYSSVEAEAMDRLLLELLPTGWLALPLFDGVLMDVPADRASALAPWVSDLMRWAMAASGVDGIGVKVEVQERWGVARKAEVE